MDPFFKSVKKLFKLLVVSFLLKIFNIFSLKYSIEGQFSRHSFLYSQVYLLSSVQFITHFFLGAIN